MRRKLTTIQVTPETRDRLRAYAVRLAASAAAGRREDSILSENNNPGHQGVSLEAALIELLDQRERYEERRAEADKRRRKGAK